MTRSAKNNTHTASPDTTAHATRRDESVETGPWTGRRSVFGGARAFSYTSTLRSTCKKHSRARRTGARYAISRLACLVSAYALGESRYATHCAACGWPAEPIIRHWGAHLTRGILYIGRSSYVCISARVERSASRT